jgi:hypothetical protein
MFANPITLLSGLGTVIVIVGVTLYNKAQEYDTLHKVMKVSKEICRLWEVRGIAVS